MTQSKGSTAPLARQQIQWKQVFPNLTEQIRLKYLDEKPSDGYTIPVAHLCRRCQTYCCCEQKATLSVSYVCVQVGLSVTDVKTELPILGSGETRSLQVDHLSLTNEIGFGIIYFQAVPDMLPSAVSCCVGMSMDRCLRDLKQCMVID